MMDSEHLVSSPLRGPGLGERVLGRVRMAYPWDLM